VKAIKGILGDLLDPERVIKHPNYGPLLLERIAASKLSYPGKNIKEQTQLGSWLYFNEILREEAINSYGIYDCAAHHPLLVKAIKCFGFL
jgi:hypothetical protein